MKPILFLSIIIALASCKKKNQTPAEEEPSKAVYSYKIGIYDKTQSGFHDTLVININGKTYSQLEARFKTGDFVEVSYHPGVDLYGNDKTAILKNRIQIVFQKADGVNPVKYIEMFLANCTCKTYFSTTAE